MLAERYVRLALSMEQHEEGYVDAYTGPPAWKAEAQAMPRSLAGLKREADAIAAQLVAQARGPEREHRRIAALRGYVASARARLDMIGGKRWKFSDEAQRIYGMRPVLRPLASYDPVLARIELLVPGTGTLADRVEALRSRYAIPAERLQAVMASAIAECRRRTLAHAQLPAGESFRMETVTGQSWSAYNWYEGNAHSLIQINVDFPVQIDRALTLGCHEGYPGHHVQGIFTEKLYRERGWVEYSISPLFSPQGPLNEGGANFGVDLAFPGSQRLAFEQATLYPLAGLDPASAPDYDRLRRATAELAGARVTIAAMYLDGKVDREHALELIQRYQLLSRARAMQNLEFTGHYRAYVLNYADGEDLVRAYVEQVDGDAARWSRYLGILSEPHLPKDLQ
jgi:hypothetical protein